MSLQIAVSQPAALTKKAMSKCVVCRDQQKVNKHMECYVQQRWQC